MPEQPAITDQIRTVVDHVALTRFDAWSKRPNRDAYVADLARTVAQAATEAAAPHIAALPGDGITEIELDAGFEDPRLVITGDMETLRELARRLGLASRPGSAAPTRTE